MKLFVVTFRKLVNPMSISITINAMNAIDAATVALNKIDNIALNDGGDNIYLSADDIQTIEKVDQ